MRRFIYITAIFSLLVLGSCKVENAKKAAGCANEHLVMATLYAQKAAEARALYYQGYNLARWRLEQILKAKKFSKKPCVITDLDETVVDNSPYQGFLIKSGKSYPEGWREWVDKAEAQALPGALEFFKFADARGVDIFYVSNRKQISLKSTMQNLQKLGFPQVEEDHFLLRTKESSKETRRKTIASTHEIVLLLGDNLNDFARVFEHQSVTRRAAVTDSLRNLFGTKFIVFPNPMYGEWEGAIYQYHWSMSPQEKDAARKAALKSFK